VSESALIIEPFDPETASDRDYDEVFDVESAAFSLDMPEDPPSERSVVEGRIRVPQAEYGRCLYWACRSEGSIVGFSLVALMPEENSQNALVRIVVHPDHRRRGIGRRMLAEALPVIRGEGRSQVLGAGLKVGAPGVEWAEGLGFRETMRMVLQVIEPGGVDRALWDLPSVPGYRIGRWQGRAPDDLVEAFAHARRAIEDVPHATGSYEHPDWNSERVRKAEQELAERNVEQRVVVAVAEASGEIAAITEIMIFPHRKNWAYQGDTAVLSQFRGSGLGRAVKAAMLRWLEEDGGEVERIYTTTGVTNVHMIRINMEVGYREVRTMIWCEATVDELADRLETASQNTET
jgi:mycothiol synthase